MSKRAMAKAYLSSRMGSMMLPLHYFRGCNTQVLNPGIDPLRCPGVRSHG